MEQDLRDKDLMELIDIAISMSSFTSGSLSTTWQIYLQRYPRKAGDGFAEGERCYEIGKTGESIFANRPGYKTLREALIAFIRTGLVEYVKRQRHDEEEATKYSKSAEDWRQHVVRIEKLIGSDIE